ncbi:hypothetical protein SO802_004796 [Lithocarpus litseifolius]|uniref:Uncharacterized protein n=1 Tax=Lithocarpus litseifolius TaxID=425828 RepID=A0AAW2DIY3_9ROSI
MGAIKRGSLGPGSGRHDCEIILELYDECMSKPRETASSCDGYLQQKEECRNFKRVIFKESKRMHGLRITEWGRNSINNIVPDSVVQPLQVIKGLVTFSPKGQVATSQRIPEYSHCKNLLKVNRGAASHVLIDGIPNYSFQVFVINGNLIPGIQEFDGDKICME